MSNAFDKGLSAYQADISASRNPYAAKTPEYDDWLDGWWTAFEEQDDETEDYDTALAREHGMPPYA